MSKRAVIIAGPNGSGKTTFANEYLKVYKFDYISADEIANEIGPGRLGKGEKLAISDEGLFNLFLHNVR